LTRHEVKVTKAGTATRKADRTNLVRAVERRVTSFEIAEV
jgi:hypothetical protein